MSNPLTDLEAVALGCVARDGPVTAYAVRRLFLDAPSARFSGSAGAIYPLLARLERRGLLRSRAAARGRRPARAYEATAAGRRALRAWLRTGLSPAEGFADDPLRTRLLFLDELSPAARLAWLEQAERAVREQAPLIAAFEEGAGDSPWVRLANENARALNRARLRWLADARRALGEAGLVPPG